MFHLVTFSCLLATTYALPPELDGRIVGGTPVYIEDYPYQLSLQSNGKHICGASILRTTWAVTAAHCTHKRNASMLSVRAGSSFRESGGQVVNVKTIHQDPDFQYPSFDYDICVLELDSELIFGPGVAAIALPSFDQDIPVGEQAVVSGWGRLESGGEKPSQLQAVELTVISNEDCSAVYGSGLITDRMMCAGEVDGGKDTCQGDSGGPLVVNNQLIGIVSWGKGCARPGYPGVYVNVAKFRKHTRKFFNF